MLQYIECFPCTPPLKYLTLIPPTATSPYSIKTWPKVFILGVVLKSGFFVEIAAPTFYILYNQCLGMNESRFRAYL